MLRNKIILVLKILFPKYSDEQHYINKLQPPDCESNNLYSDSHQGVEMTFTSVIMVNGCHIFVLGSILLDSLKSISEIDFF